MKELIEQLLENCKSDLIQDQVAKRLTKSGKSAATLEVTGVTDTSGQLLSGDAILAQIFGRAPGKQPPTNAIIEWIESARIKPDGISIESLAFLIARKIGREGTDIWKGLQPALGFHVIVEQNTSLFVKEFQDLYAKEIEDMTYKILTQ
jgi:uncharacterized protein YheU (UPF0270 family)